VNQQNDYEPSGSIGPVLAVIVVSLAIAGFFIGLQAPMTDHRSQAARSSNAITSVEPGSQFVKPLAKSALSQPPVAEPLASTPDVLPATHYSEMAQAIRARKNRQRIQEKWPGQPETAVAQEEQIVIAPADKNFALELRRLNRAFNGAPPTVPHSIDQMSSESCMLCHEQGFKLSTLRASKMSHQFLSECTQCHVENNPTHQPASLFGETTFVGLPPPKEGPRAYTGAPPQIPHTTWMRVECLSCHGPNGAHGIRTTHPWRQDCQQCHAVASSLEQSQPDSIPAFLPPLRVTP